MSETNKEKEIVPDLHEVVKQAINAVNRIYIDIDRLYDAMHLSEAQKGETEESEGPKREVGSIEELDTDVRYLRMRIDVVEGRLNRELNYLLGSS